MEYGRDRLKSLPAPRPPLAIIVLMTPVEIVYRYTTLPTQQTALALAAVRDVYGIRHLAFNQSERTLRIEYDATRLSAAAVTRLVREAGLDAEQQVVAPEPAPAA